MIFKQVKLTWTVFFAAREHSGSTKGMEFLIKSAIISFWRRTLLHWVR